MGYSVLLPVCYLSVVNSCPQNRKKNIMDSINPVPLASFNTGAVEDVCDVVLDSWWRSQWWLDWWNCVLVWNKIFGNFYLCTSECLKVLVRWRSRPASSVTVSTM